MAFPTPQLRTQCALRVLECGVSPPFLTLPRALPGSGTRLLTPDACTQWSQHLHTPVASVASL